MPHNHYTDEEKNAIFIAMAGNVFISFSGFNCDELNDSMCAGWDGESRRCSCGNRRVAWAFRRDKAGTLIAYAEAY